MSVDPSNTLLTAVSSAERAAISSESRGKIPESSLVLVASGSVKEVSPGWAELLARSSTYTAGESRPESLSKLERTSVLGRGLAAGDEAALADDCDARAPGVFDLTTARARRSWRRSFLRAFDELRETKKKKKKKRSHC